MTDDCVVPKNVTLDKDGYPRIKWNKRIWRMNRLMWTLVNGQIPEGMVVAHKCNNPSCINTNHFYVCSPKENSSDAASDGLYATGSRNGRFKATPEIVEKILHCYHALNWSQARIGELVGISQSQVSFLIRTNANNSLPPCSTDYPPYLQSAHR